MTSPASSPGDVLPIRVRSQTGDVVVSPTVAELDALVRRIGGADDRFLVLERVPYAPRAFIQTFRDDEKYNVEYRDGGRDQFATTIADVADVARLLTAWATDRPAWRSGWNWEPSYRHPDVDVTPLSKPAERAATRLAHRYLAEGYLSFEAMAQTISECAGDGTQVTIEQAETLLEPLWAKRVAEQRSWPSVTDADRVEAALRRLRADGITARADFACCHNCGTAEIGAVAAETDHGYVFFHHQDTERAVDGTLFLSFGAYTDADDDGAAVGHRVVAAMVAEGLTTEWDGSPRHRITVADLDWRKRLQ